MPYIYEDRISQKDFESTLNKALKLSKNKYSELSDKCIQHVKDNFNFENYEKSWIELFDKIIDESGSWETRKNYERWHLLEVA